MFTGGQELQSNIWKFYVLRIFVRSLVFPILVVYFLRSGLSAAEIGLVFAIGIYAAFLLELPSGYISDTIGHKYAVVVCFFMKALSMLCYLGGTFWWFVAAEVLFVGGGALWSGTGEAFLFETAKDLEPISKYPWPRYRPISSDRFVDFEKLYGRSMSVGLSLSSVFLILMPFLYAYDNQSVFFAGFLLLLIPFGIALTLKQPSYGKSVAKIEGWWGVMREWRTIGTFIAKQKRYRALVLFYSFWQATQDAIDLFSQLFFAFIKIPVQFFGTLYAANRILQALGGHIAYLFTKTMGSIKVLALFSVELALFFFFGAYANQYFGILLFPARNFFEGVSGPTSSGMINKEITEGYRITLLSVEPTVTRFIQGILVFILGILFDAFSVPHVFLITGVAVSVIMVILYLGAARSLAAKGA